MVKITIVGRDGAPINYPENSNAEAVKKRLIAAFGPGLLMRDGEGIVSETLSGEYEFHVTGKIFSSHYLFLLFVSASFPVTNNIQ